jgi:hypothetical protein
MSNGITHPATQPTPPDTPQNWIMLVLTLILISVTYEEGSRHVAGAPLRILNS